MKIGILTQPLVSNYGGILQNYALQQILRTLGHDPYTLDVWIPSWNIWIRQFVKYIIRILKGGRIENRPLTPPEKIKEYNPLRIFVKSHISLIPNISNYSKSVVKRNKFDCLIVGSDQVWRPLYNLNIEDMFLRFVKGTNLKRIAYAASFGIDKWEYNDRQTVECKELAKLFDAISVREESGILLCKEKFGVKAEWVIDPTLLLKQENYSDLCSCIPKKVMGVFAYILDSDKKKVALIKSFAKTKGLPCSIVSSGVELTSEDSVEKWLANIRDASYVITDSFHGTVFSIIFQKEFYVLENEGRGNSRFDTLLSKFELQERMISEIPYNDNIIDWEKVNLLKNMYESQSIKWLKENLTKSL